MSKLNLKAALDRVDKSSTLCTNGRREVKEILAAFAGEKVESEYITVDTMIDLRLYKSSHTYNGNFVYTKIGDQLFYLEKNHSRLHLITFNSFTLKDTIKVRKLKIFKGELKW